MFILVLNFLYAPSLSLIKMVRSCKVGIKENNNFIAFFKSSLNQTHRTPYKISLKTNFHKIHRKPKMLTSTELRAPLLASRHSLISTTKMLALRDGLLLNTHQKKSEMHPPAKIFHQFVFWGKKEEEEKKHHSNITTRNTKPTSTAETHKCKYWSCKKKCKIKNELYIGLMFRRV